MSALFPPSQPCHLKTSGSLSSCASACRSSAPSSTAKCVEKSLCTNCSATRGEKKKNKPLTLKKPVLFYTLAKVVRPFVAALRLNFIAVVVVFSSLQELLQSSRKLSLKVLSFVQSFQVKTRPLPQAACSRSSQNINSLTKGWVSLSHPTARLLNNSETF